MHDLDSYPAFRVAYLSWVQLTRNPLYNDEISRAKDTSVKQVGKAFDAVLDAAAAWQEGQLPRKVDGFKALQPYITEMLLWFTERYGISQTSYPEGTVGVYDHDTGKQVQKTYHFPCWYPDYENYIHHTGQLSNWHIFMRRLINYTKDRFRAAATGVGRHRFKVVISEIAPELLDAGRRIRTEAETKRTVEARSRMVNAIMAETKPNLSESESRSLLFAVGGSVRERISEQTADELVGALRNAGVPARKEATATFFTEYKRYMAFLREREDVKNELWAQQGIIERVEGAMSEAGAKDRAAHTEAVRGPPEWKTRPTTKALSFMALQMPRGRKE
jgi:hypothetical protein